MSIGIYNYFFVTGTGNVTASDAVTYLNGTSFSVSSTQTPVLFEFVKYSEGGLKKHTFVFTGSPGTYGNGGAAVVAAQLDLLNEQVFLEADFVNYPSLNITAVTVSETNYINAFNAGTYTFVSGTVYLFSFSYLGVTYYKLYTGNSGTFGAGNPFTIHNFVDATDSGLQPGVWATVSRMVATSSAGTLSDSNYWTRLASVILGSDAIKQISDFSITLLFQSNNTRLQTAIVAFSGRLNNNTPEMLNAQIMGMSAPATVSSSQYMFADDSFKIFVDADSDSVNHVFEIYVKKACTYGQFRVQELARYFSLASSNIIYYSNQPWESSEPLGNPFAKSNGLYYNQQKILTPVTAAATYSKADYLSDDQVFYTTDNNTAYNIIDSFTNLPITLEKVSPSDYTVDNIFYFEINGVFYKRNFGGVINAKSIGAGLGDDDTAILQKAFTFEKKLFFPAGIYRVRNFTIPAGVEVYGIGYNSVLQFCSSSNEGTDSQAWTVISNDYHSSVHDLRITGNKIDGIYKPGNGLLIKTTPYGMARSFYNIYVEYFAAYVDSPSGKGTYGLNKNLTATDLSSNSSLNGGNGIRCDNGDKAWELYMNNIRISALDGVGFDFGRVSDSKLSNFWIGSCANAGFIATHNNGNNQVSNLKVFRCHMLNFMDNYDTARNTIIPFVAPSGSGPLAAIMLTGSHNIFTNIEAQENGLHGVLLGSASIGFMHSAINGLLVDGNGGINGSPDASLMGYGLFLYNFYNIIINGIASDFRSKTLENRQMYGVYSIINKPAISSAASIQKGLYYRIKALAECTDFIPLMGDQLANPQNTIGFVFQAAYSSLDVPINTNFGKDNGGSLEAINDNLTLTMAISDNYDQIHNLGTGYKLDTIGNNSTVIINGNLLVESNLRSVVTDANYTMSRLDHVVAYATLSATRTVYLPLVATAITNKKYTVKDESGNAVTCNVALQPSSADTGVTIDGASSKVINAAYGYITVYSNGTQWFTVN